MKANETLLKLAAFIEEAKRHYNTPVNLPLYCRLGIGNERLTYNEYVETYGFEPPLQDQVPQCHICTRFETDDNPLFAYSYLEKDNEFKFIYRCRKGHGHDQGMVIIDCYTGLKVYL